ncbi:hypothetical protein [Kordia sp.]|uniref:hypothetical protein n=1 Tax=Kordia sp. TaxID=1965332 RepID=UPI003D6BA4EA
MKRNLLLILLCTTSYIYSQTSCPFDESLFSGTLTVTTAGASKTKASDATSNYRFGERVAIDGNIAAVVSRSNGAAAGKVYIFTNDGSGNWTEQTTISASDGFAGDNFGSAVALEGNYLLVGARSQLDAADVDTGAAYLFEYNGVDTWTQVAIFEPSDGATGIRFGESVSIEGDLVLVGARNGCTGGCAYVYENDGTNTFTYTETKLEPQVQSGYSGARFGSDVQLKDGRAYVSGPYDYSVVGNASAGSVQIWDQANDGTWSRTHRLRGTETSEAFGWSVDVEGDYLAIGAMNFETSTTPEADQGRVYVYKADANGDYLEANSVMIQNDDKDSFNDQRFGTDVALDGEYLYVGTFGNGAINSDALYIFKDDGTNNWTQIAKITSGAGWDEFANRAVAVSFPYLLIGQNEDDSPSKSGAVYFVPLANQVEPVASVTETVGVNTTQSNGIIKVSFDDEATETQIKFSIDGGNTYPYTFDDTLGNGEITNLAIGTYDIWVAFDESSCPISLGSFDINEIPYTAIPDANFEARLEALGYDDISADGQVPTALIENVTSLTANNLGINDLTGIEDFAALTLLSCRANNLTALDISQNVLLETLTANNNDILAINLSNNTALTSINLGANDFTTLDVSNNTALISLSLQANSGLTSIDVSNNTLLQQLRTYATNIATLDISNNPDLELLFAYNSPITAIDVSNNPAIEELRVNGTDVTALDLSNNPNIITLRVNGTNITSLDLSNQTAFKNLFASDTNLNYLNVKNGNNTNVGTFSIANNPSLSCVVVDDAAYSTTNWTNIDTGIVSFSDTYCRYTAIPDTNFEAALEALGYDDISADGQVPTALIEVVTSLSTQFQDITDFTGIEDFLALESLTVSYNSFTSLDVTNNVNLTFLNCGYSSLTSLDVSNNVLLETLWVNSSAISTLDLSQNINLTSLTASAMSNLTALNMQNGNNANVTHFTTIGTTNLYCILVDDAAYSTTNWDDVEDHTVFNETDCLAYTAIPDANFEAALEALGHDDISSDGQVLTALIEVVTNLNVSNEGITDLTGIEDFIALTSLNVSDNTIGSLDITNSPNLVTLTASACGLSSLDISQNTLLENLSADSNQLTSLNTTNNTALKTVVLYGNLIATADFSTNTTLETLDLFQNQLTSLDLSNNTALKTLFCDNNELISLNVQNGNNAAITDFNALNNDDLYCILVDNEAYSTTNWGNKDTQANYNETSCDFVIVDVDVFLQGALINPNTGEESLMRDDLRIAGGIYDSNSPYGDGASINETVGLSDNDANSTVDWIWVELRDANSSATVIAGQSGILQRDGDIVATDDDLVTPLTFENVPAGDYYIVIKHRNHLSIMSATAITLKQVSTTIDFTDANNQITYGSNAQTTFGMPTDVVAMWCGNANDDTIVQYSGTNPDTPEILSTVLNDAGNFLNFPTYVVSGYDANDVNMDGNTQYSGTDPDVPFILQNILAHPSNFLGFSTYQIIEQLPENE